MRPVRVLPATDVAHLARDESRLLRLAVPWHWKSPVSISPHAGAAAAAILEWFEQLGCTAAELDRAERFDIGGYVGIPFPTLDCEQTTRIGKYLALWLLWDDVHVEQLSNDWRIDAAAVLGNRRPPGLTRFDEGWWQLMQEFRVNRSPTWIRRLCDAMQQWSDAAAAEAAVAFHHHETGEVPPFADQLERRIATIGMYGTACLLEEIHDDEPPIAFHAHPIVQMLQYLSSKIVGLGNDMFSLAKDCVENQLNLVSTLMHESSVGVRDALAMLVRLHDEALVQFDHLAAQIEPWAIRIYPGAERWVQDLRVASLGFSLWESQAPRYLAHQIVDNERVLLPRFSYLDQPQPKPQAQPKPQIVEAFGPLAAGHDCR
ncbi:terpene synthase family protein [Enhygromyxa salina]|uniref:Terpene synthase family, metal binding domain n=1 Tax=Enhygromyxa salina TaxID=215803 RepID=A0A2S9XUC3_9BACT|nr:terpene synthase family protein [Enhygromyxa salina]PRP96477.1 Terpene synthase family, metal binding domain [Enhygromyxa salina]